MDYDYMEITLLVSEDDLCYNIPSSKFDALLQHIKTDSLFNTCKVFQNDIIETKHGALHRMQYMDGEKVKECKIYDVSLKRHEVVNGFVETKYMRRKIPDVLFPSTNKYDMRRLIRRLTFRMNNRVFLNFQQELEDDGVIRRKVFINYNHSSDVDVKETTDIMRKIKTALRNDGNPFVEPGV